MDVAGGRRAAFADVTATTPQVARRPQPPLDARYAGTVGKHPPELVGTPTVRFADGSGIVFGDGSRAERQALRRFLSDPDLQQIEAVATLRHLVLRERSGDPGPVRTSRIIFNVLSADEMTLAQTVTINPNWLGTQTGDQFRMIGDVHTELRRMGVDLAHGDTPDPDD
jgi:hypothetical protein